MPTMHAGNRAMQVKKQDKLQKVTEAEIKKSGTQMLNNADQGIQTSVVSENGKVRSVIGLNGCRYLPDPDPDPLEEILYAALHPSLEKSK
jgi:hypothetical protein